MQDIWDGGGMEDCLEKEQEPPKRGMERRANVVWRKNGTIYRRLLIWIIGKSDASSSRRRTFFSVLWSHLVRTSSKVPAAVYKTSLLVYMQTLPGYPFLKGEKHVISLSITIVEQCLTQRCPINACSTTE